MERAWGIAWVLGITVAIAIGVFVGARWFQSEVRYQVDQNRQAPASATASRNILPQTTRGASQARLANLYPANGKDYGINKVPLVAGDLFTLNADDRFWICWSMVGNDDAIEVVNGRVDNRSTFKVLKTGGHLYATVDTVQGRCAKIQ